MGPTGQGVPQPGPVIMDPRGELIWMSQEWGSVMGFTMQTYKGKNYLTFWAGRKHGSTGKGDFFMLDSNYKVAYRLHAVGENKFGEIHEFKITDQGTALISVWAREQADLRKMNSWKPSDGWLMGGVFQEIDIETNELLFEWNASEHVKLGDTFYFDPLGGYWESHPFDFYHLNSIEKDSKGNYLISSRHYHTITYIDGSSGEVLWELGAGSEDFTDLSDGHASDFQWQHNPRWVSEEEGTLTFLDNGMAGPLHVDAPYSKGKMVKLDHENRTVELLAEYLSQGHVRAPSQGNLQVLSEPNDHVIVGWGATAAYSEFHVDGTLLCETHFTASLFFWWEQWKTYRVYRLHGWVSTPDYPPSAKIKGDSLYVSWNGATEVAYWELQGARNDGRGHEIFESLDLVEKHSFEEAFILPTEGDYLRYRVGALDVEKKVLRFSDLVQVESESGWSVIGLLIGVGAGVGTAIGVGYILRIRVRRGKEGGKVLTWEPTSNLFNLEQYQYSKL